MIQTVVFFTLALLSVGYFMLEVYRRYRITISGKPEDRGGKPLKRLSYLAGQVLLNRRIGRYRLFGLSHALLMWGFIILTIGAVDMILRHLFQIRLPFAVDGSVYSALRTGVIILVILAVGACLGRRFVRKPTWLSNNTESFTILGMILLVVITEQIFYSTVRFPLVQAISWWVHFLAMLAFLVFIPYTKHFHLCFAVFNTYWHTLAPKGALLPVRLDPERSEAPYGVSRPEDFSWKQIFDAFACVKCGRCNGSCPTYQCGEDMKPKRLNGKLRQYFEAKYPLFRKGGGAGAGTKKRKKKKTPSASKMIVGGILAEEFLWSCTTCGACMEACPISCENMFKVIDIRRNHTSSGKNIPEEIVRVFDGIREAGSPWGERRDSDAHCAKDLGIPTIEENPGAEFLYFVGCAPASSPSARRTAAAFARLLTTAGVNVAILGEAEWCCGDTARRLGNERLFQETVRKNIALLREYGVEKILTTCPHCFNTLKNEYGDFGGRYEVISHAVFLTGLLEAGRLTSRNSRNLSVTYHDPCYLGRYNGVYTEPRKIIHALSGRGLVEMPQTRENSFCCGAGGGRFWLENEAGNVISQTRLREALDTGADIVATACPYCRMALEREIERQPGDRAVDIRDIAEILADGICLP